MLRVAFLWHMHQPFYGDPSTGKMVMPWVRLHCLKDYYDLPARVGNFENLKMTFNLVPSLVEQIELYSTGQTTDRHLELTEKNTDDLTREEKVEIFKSFFSANLKTMIEPHSRYYRLYQKLTDCGFDHNLAVRTGSSQDIRDLVVWSNLAWVDPSFHSQEPFKSLLEKGESFSEEDKKRLLDGQKKIIGDVIPCYKTLQDQGKIEVSMAPYFHPILPLLCDTDSAKEALPSISLPRNRFTHPEDAERQIALAVEKYRDVFGGELTGMWPSEGSISEAMAPLVAKFGIKWLASDEQVLYASLAKSGHPPGGSPHAVYRYGTDQGSLSLFFRDHALSDRIGFVYSGWDADKAVNDFIDHLHQLEKIIGDNPNAVVPVILDGENCWEYYDRDGDDFLNLLFEQLNRDKMIETITMSEAAERLQPIDLPHIQAGSWINHNFRIWIGHSEDNTAWDLLYDARQALTGFKNSNPEFDATRLARAEKSLMVAEGSDWNWWYGDEHRGSHNEEFDQLYRAHLSAVYSELGLEIPRLLLSPISSNLPETFVTEPDGIVSPTIDGQLTHYYEWLGSGKFDCLKAGGATHRVDRAISALYYAADEKNIYFRVDFLDKRFLIDNNEKQVQLEIISPVSGIFLMSRQGLIEQPDWLTDSNGFSFSLGEIAEFGLDRKVIFPEGGGDLFFKIGLVEDGKILEVWPASDPIRFALSDWGEEIVWDL